MPAPRVSWKQQRINRAEAWVAARKAAGLPLERAPRPDGVMPVDDPEEVCPPLIWTGERWQAWVMLHDGQSSRMVSEAMNKQKATIDEWRRLWFIRYGLRIKTTQAAQTTVDRRYKLAKDETSPEYRRRMATEELDEAGAQTISLLQRYLRMVGDDENRLLAMSPKEAGELLTLGQRVFELATQLQAGQGIAPGRSGAGSDSSAKLALTGLTGGRKRGSKSSSAVDPAAASAGLTSLRGTLTRYRDAVAAHDDDEESAAG